MSTMTTKQTAFRAAAFVPRPRGSSEVDSTADWTAAAACLGADPDALFVQGAEQQQAKIVCQRCPVRTECLADALDNRVEFGVWGGMTERERRALLRRRPNVTSWRRLLDAARTEHEARERAERGFPATG
jgi:WhiB family transcriptional regulator, redox-sensing transcriptional regulator